MGDTVNGRRGGEETDVWKRARVCLVGEKICVFGTITYFVVI